MGHVEVAHISHALPDGRELLDDVSFRVGEGTVAALVGPNGAGKTTLMRLIAGDLTPQAGTVTFSGGLGVMRQFVGGIRAAGARGAGIGGSGGRAGPGPEPAGSAGDREHESRSPTSAASAELPVRDLLLSVAPLRVRAAAARLDAAELVMMERDDEPAQLRYAAALAEWGDAGGYDAEVHWDACTVAALGHPVRAVPVAGGAHAVRRRAEAAGAGGAAARPGRGPAARRAGQLPGRAGQALAGAAAGGHAARRCCWSATTGSCWPTAPSGSSPWRTATSGCTAAGSRRYAQARRDRIERLDELRRRWDEEHEKLKQLVRMYRQKASYNDAMASRLQAAETRLRKFEEAGPPELAPREQNVRMRLRGGRTGKRAVICEQLELTGLMQPFDLEVWYGERVAVLGSNGSGKSHFLRLLGGRAGGARGRGPARRPGGARAVRADPRPARPGRPQRRWRSS